MRAAALTLVLAACGPVDAPPPDDTRAPEYVAPRPTACPPPFRALVVQHTARFGRASVTASDGTLYDSGAVYSTTATLYVRGVVNDGFRCTEPVELCASILRVDGTPGGIFAPLALLDGYGRVLASWTRRTQGGAESRCVDGSVLP